MAGLTESQASLLTAANHAWATTLRADGSPHATVVWVDWDGEHVTFNTAVGRAKERHLRANPAIAVSVLDPADPFHYVSVSGTAELVTEGADEHINRMSEKYTGNPVYQMRQPGEERIIVRFRPEQVVGIG